MVTSTCIEWPHCRDRQRGYGWMRRNGKMVRAHRAAWEDAHGPIPPGLFVCHHCDNPSCVNVEHLFLGTHRDNMADCVKKNRKHRACGEQNGNSKLTEDQVLAILADPRSQRIIAADYNVTKTLIANIKHRRTWTHVGPQTRHRMLGDD